MSHTTAAGFVRCVLALLLILPRLLPWAHAEEPLRDEDIVRLLVGGTDSGKLIELIRSRAVEFDLSQEMLDELSVAGVPAEVIQAMVERQAEMDGNDGQVNEEAAQPSAEPVPPNFTIRVNPSAGEAVESPSLLRVGDAVNPRLAELLGLDMTRPENERLTDLAVFLVCRTQDHVPDHWRSQSPLGRDFVSMPRHRLLTFLTGARRDPVSKAGVRRKGQPSPHNEALVLQLPETIEVELAPDVAHDLSLGIAVQVGGRFYRLIDDHWDGLIPQPSDLEADAYLTGDDLRLSSLEVRFDRAESAAPDRDH